MTDYSFREDEKEAARKTWSENYKECECKELSFSETQKALEEMINLAPELALTSPSEELRRFAEAKMKERATIRKDIVSALDILGDQDVSRTDAILKLPELMKKYALIYTNLAQLEKQFAALTKKGVCVTQFTKDLVNANS